MAGVTGLLGTLSTVRHRLRLRSHCMKGVTVNVYKLLGPIYTRSQRHVCNIASDLATNIKD